MLATPELIVSVHGVGEHEPEQVAAEVATGLGADNKTPVVDFNWCKTVEAYDRDRIVELSDSIASANSHGEASSTFIGLISSATELVWGFLFLVLAMLPLVVAPTVYLYVMLPEFSLSDVAVPGFVRPLLTAVLWIAVLATALLLLAGAAVLIAGRRLAACWLLRRSLLLVLRPVIALLFWLSGLDDLFRSIGKFGLGLIILNVGAFLFGQSVGWLFGASWDLDHALRVLQAASMLVTAMLAAGAILGIAARAFAQPIKFFRDVFNYIGSPSTRGRIQDALTRTAASLPADKNIVLAGHSLGSVIAVDSLINSNAWGHVQSIVLVTGGSPIRRWFQRFFPDLYFPSDGGSLADTAMRNSPVVAWVNVFRPKDPVGASLELPDENCVRDVETARDDLTGIDAHSHYWSAQDVHEALKRVWNSLTPGPSAIDKVPYGLTEIPARRVRAILGGSTVPAMLVAALAAIALGITSYFETVNARLESNKAFVADAMSGGTRVPASVSHRQFWRPSGEHSYPVQRFVFSYQTPEGAPRPDVILTEVHGNILECCQLFESEALLADLRPGDDLDDAYDFSIEIAYLPEVLDKVTVPDYPPTVTKIPWYYDLIFLLLYAIFGVGLMGMLGLAASIKLLELLVPETQADA